jgi:hypothetical protein
MLSMDSQDYKRNMNINTDSDKQSGLRYNDRDSRKRFEIPSIG